ncbi:MAG: hypothetical protein NTY19_22030 [Planctomycetota bacterium]|nr:hypothetical protein [Planctomycetota bacterium]
MSHRQRCYRSAFLILALLSMATQGTGNAWGAQPTKSVRTQVVNRGGKWTLLRDGQPCFIKGGGGGGSKAALARCGGNSIRTWGIGPETQRELEEAQQLGLTVTVGHWLGHQDQGFNYNDAAAVKKQFDDVRRAVLKYKEHPAVLIWALGNEMELDNDTPLLWKAVQDLALMVHEIDPHRPTMTVVAEIGGDKVKNIHKYCPDIDVIGINCYGGGPSLAERYRKAGGTKPFVITEFGPPGTWEIPLNTFGAAPELTSTEKAKCYLATYTKSVLGAPDVCLGSYAFTWGYKIEATATWFGMLLPDQSKLAAVDTMQELWSGKPPAHPCPVMKKLAWLGKDQVLGGETVKARVEAAAAQGDTLKIEWVLCSEQANYGVQGTGADATPEFPEAIAKNSETQVTVQMPKSGGIYRLYCYVRNAYGGAAVGSLPIQVAGPKTPVKPLVVKLPLVVYSDEQQAPPYVASGWMGNHQAVSMDSDCTDNPHSGKTCLKVTYKDSGNWAGVVWQHPANDWGEKPGGYDVTGAEHLTFWARGQEGGEKVKFGYGTIQIEKKYHDSSKGELEVTLTKDWKQYQFDLSERELYRIKSGFLWSLAGQGKPVTFYLDDVEYR